MAALPLPDRDRLSALAALMLLAIGLVQVVVLPVVPIEVAAIGLILRLEINSAFVLISLAAGVTVAGTDWLARTHPRPPVGRARLEPVVVPGLATLAAGAILTRVPPGAGLWIGLGLAAAVLMGVVVAEFLVIDPADPRREAAVIGLTALAQVLLTGVYFALFSLGVRALFSVPLAFLATGAVSWRLLHLRHPRASSGRYAAMVGAAMAQLAWGLNYLPLSPGKSAIGMGLLAYLATDAMAAHLAGRLRRRLAIEYGVVTAVGFAGLALLG